MGAAPTEDAGDSGDLLRRLVDGYQVSQAIHVAAALGLADRLEDGPLDSDALATGCGAHPGALLRLLRALASVGVLREHEGRRFGLTAVGEHLRTGAEEPLGGWAAYVGRPYRWQPWAHLVHSVRTGESAFRHAHGVGIWEYWERNPDEGALFDRAMTDGSLATNRALLGAFDFGRFGCVVDVGGGQGAFLAALLERHPEARGILFDLPKVVEAAAEVLRAAGVEGRCSVVGGSFFDAVPAGGDAYVLGGVLHDWEDEDAAAILRACREAAESGAALVVLERELGPPNEKPEAKLSDLNMLVGPGGRERTLDEYGALLAGAGFRLLGMTPTRSGIDAIEAVAA